ncbi:hypothetical protein SK128_024945 [Halocaridina rubra]|uniref:Uncharacterized protein n=1 Tax=Halocaridina rubra TaxID=373956 RepID=A0AAN8X0H8_HALRR
MPGNLKSPFNEIVYQAKLVIKQNLSLHSLDDACCLCQRVTVYQWQISSKCNA